MLAHTLKRIKLKSVVIFNVGKINKRKRIYLQMHLLSEMSHGRPVRLGKKWSGPPKIEITFIGINPISIHEILVENVC